MKPRNTEIDELQHNGLGELVVKLTNEDDAKTGRVRSYYIFLNLKFSFNFVVLRWRFVRV